MINKRGNVNPIAKMNDEASGWQWGRRRPRDGGYTLRRPAATVPFATGRWKWTYLHDPPRAHFASFLDNFSLPLSVQTR